MDITKLFMGKKESRPEVNISFIVHLDQSYELASEGFFNCEPFKLTQEDLLAFYLGGDSVTTSNGVYKLIRTSSESFTSKHNSAPGVFLNRRYEKIKNVDNRR